MTFDDEADLTILLLNEQRPYDYNSKFGKHLNVKPVIGVLTSTARTFVQDGVTTEFATQIVGTTLDNGRVYAQILTKSSLILYNKPTNVNEVVKVRPTIHFPLNRKENWRAQQDDGLIDPEIYFLKNIGVKNDPRQAKKHSEYWDNLRVAGTPEQTNGSQFKEITAKFKLDNKYYNVSDVMLNNNYDEDLKVKPLEIKHKSNLNENSNQKLFFPNGHVNPDLVKLSNHNEEINIVKVRPSNNLPTFTIKNEFSPIFYYIDNIESRNSFQEMEKPQQPKKLFDHDNEYQPKKTFTYAGFAEFTTVVGDTVIIFTPNSENTKSKNVAHFDVSQSSRPEKNKESKITFLSSDIPAASSTFKYHEYSKSKYDVLDDMKSPKYNSTQKNFVNENVEHVSPSLKLKPKNNFDLNFEVIQPSESIAASTESIHIGENANIASLGSSSAIPTEPLSTSKIVLSNVNNQLLLDKEKTQQNELNESEENKVSQADTGEYNDITESQTSTDDLIDSSTELLDDDYNQESTEENDETTKKQEEIHFEEPVCSSSFLSTLTTEYKTLTYFTTYLIPLEKTKTVTSIKTNIITETSSHYNTICPSNLATPVFDGFNISQSIISYANESKVTENSNIESSRMTNEIKNFNENNINISNENINNFNNKEIDDRENEIDVIFKTFYTTFTYFTTFFGEKTSSITSHKSVTTSVITSSIDVHNLNPSMLEAFNEFQIMPTKVLTDHASESNALHSIVDLVKNKNIIESVESENKYLSRFPTPKLSDHVLNNINSNIVKTFYTTYTFFTTIFVGQNENVCSRTETHTNYIGPENLLPTKTSTVLIPSTRAQFDFRNCKQTNKSMKEYMSHFKNNSTNFKDIKGDTVHASPVEVDMLLSIESNPFESDGSFITDIQSSFSSGEKQFLNNKDILDDQISSESNVDEIFPSPTFLLQTSYTTFTYFTTLYLGKDSSNVKSRLETITNVVTETITPKKDLDEEVPITYYTTFTYWTTLFKDKLTTITSREEVVSNIVTPVLKNIAATSSLDILTPEVNSNKSKSINSEKIEVDIIKPSSINSDNGFDDEKATFYTTYTYFTTFYVGNTSQVKSRLETITSVIDNTKMLDQNALARKVPNAHQNLIDESEIKTRLKETISPTLLNDNNVIVPTVLLDATNNNSSSSITRNIKKEDVAQKLDSFPISQSSFHLKNNQADETSTKTDILLNSSDNNRNSFIASPEVVESSQLLEKKENGQLEINDPNSSKKSRLTFSVKKSSFTPVIIPFASRNRPTFSPKKVQITNSATTITRVNFTPTITATPVLKSLRSSGFSNIKKLVSSSVQPTRRFTGRNTISSLSANISPTAKFSKGSLTSKRNTARSSKNSNYEYGSRSSLSRVRPTLSIKLKSSRSSALVEEKNNTNEYTDSENLPENNEEYRETTTKNSLSRFRRPPSFRQGSIPNVPKISSGKSGSISKTKTTTTPRVSTVRTTPNPLLLLRKQRPNSLFPRRNLFKQTEPEPEKTEDDKKILEENEEILETEDFEEDNDYDSSNKKEQHVLTTTTNSPKSSSKKVQIRPFVFRKRNKRQADYGNRKYNFRRPLPKNSNTRQSLMEYETEPISSSTQKQGANKRYNARNSLNQRLSTIHPSKSASRQPFIIRGESKTTQSPAYKRNNIRSRTPTVSTKPKTPRINNRVSHPDWSRSNSRTTSSRSRTRNTNKNSSRQRNSFENFSGERQNYNQIVNDGKITITYHIPTEVSIPVYNGKSTEYKNVVTAKQSIETLFINQISTSVSPLGNEQLVLASESTEFGENGVTKIIKFVLHESPTTTVIFTPTTIRGRKTSYSHILPSTVYNVEPITQTITPEINANVPLANLLLSQLLLGNQQPAVNPLLALQGPALSPPQNQMPITEFKTRTTTYVTTLTNLRETILPITFRGKAIVTTIIDPTENVITATEFITDTVITTPTILTPAVPQLNSLLLPFLLQQQQQQQQFLASQPSNLVTGLSQSDISVLPNNNLNNEIYNLRPDTLSTDKTNKDVYENEQDFEENSVPLQPKSLKAKNKFNNLPTRIASIVTLYVSGKHPGEFSTVLSTILSDDTQIINKREAIYYGKNQLPSSILPSVSIYDENNIIENSFISDFEQELLSSSADSQMETQSLESIVGELNEHLRYQSSTLPPRLETNTITLS